ncbi:TPA: hypothetical protein ACRB0F_001681 [Legionella anisa]|uniref:hypothetical protein n=1 Tax=Legionella anisa TaxID=28082 RepID=UPI002244C7CC|nr:hypothetical protein [Legionella anisa]MCW8423069.1 winged helix-turn-helix domain-containing protein [Legionella anisa]
MDWLIFFSKTFWPITILVIMLVFRKDIHSLLNRIKSAQFGNYRAEFDVTQNQRIIQDSMSEVGINEDQTTTTPVFYESQTKINSDLLTKLGNKEAVNELCKNNFPIIFLNYSFFKIYLNIFGTQIELLFYLNSIHQVKEQNLQQFYLKGKEQYPDVYNNITFNSYILFLKNNGLIQDLDGNYSITPLGRDFIKFLNFESPPLRIF